MAVVEACRELKTELRGRAATTWGCDLEEVEWVDGEAVHSPGEHDALSLGAITAAAKRTGGPLSSTASLNARGAGPAFSAQVCDIAVDKETGQTTVVRYTTAQDAGTAIHPSYVEGQMQGGVVQGIGWALNEEYIHDANGVMEKLQLSRLPDPGCVRPAVHRDDHRRGTEPCAPLRSSWCRRGRDRSASGCGCQRRIWRHRQADLRPSPVTGSYPRRPRRELSPMAHVHFASGQRSLTGGVAELEVEAATVRELLNKLEDLFPGIRAHLDEISATAVAIDGDIIPDAMYEPVPPNAEIHFVTPLAGG